MIQNTSVMKFNKINILKSPSFYKNRTHPNILFYVEVCRKMIRKISLNVTCDLIVR